VFERDLITLDFEASAIRFLLLRGGSAAGWESLTLPAEVMHQGLVSDPAAAGAALGQLLERHQVGRATVVACLTGHRAISRQVSLPPVRDRLLGETIRHKVRQDFPLPFEDTDLTWHVLDRSPEAIEVYVLAVPREAVDGVVASLRQAGRKARSLDLRPLALARLAGPDHGVLVNLEEQSLTILVLRDGIPAVVRTVPFTTMRPTPEARLELLLQELARTTKFFNEGHRQAPLSQAAPLLATGELLQREDMLQALRRQHRGAVNLPAAPMPHPPDLPLATYAVNLGLAAKKA